MKSRIWLQAPSTIVRQVLAAALLWPLGVMGADAAQSAPRSPASAQNDQKTFQERVDVPRVLVDLRVLDDTVVYYILGDNGASAEGTINGTFNELLMLNGAAAFETSRIPRPKKSSAT